MSVGWPVSGSISSTLAISRRNREGGVWACRLPVFSCLTRVAIRARLSKMIETCRSGSMSSPPAGTQYTPSSVHRASHSS